MISPAEKADQQVSKAQMLLWRKDFDKAIESLKKAIQLANEHEPASEDDDLHFSCLIQAHCILGEIHFMKSDYALAVECFRFIENNAEEIYKNWDDALNHELQTSELLLSLIERYT